MEDREQVFQDGGRVGWAGREQEEEPDLAFVLVPKPVPGCPLAVPSCSDLCSFNSTDPSCPIGATAVLPGIKGNISTLPGLAQPPSYMDFSTGTPSSLFQPNLGLCCQGTNCTNTV